MTRFVVTHSKALTPRYVAGAFRNAAACGASELVFKAPTVRAQLGTARLQDSRAEMPAQLRALAARLDEMCFEMRKRETSHDA